MTLIDVLASRFRFLLSKYVYIDFIKQSIGEQMFELNNEQRKCFGLRDVEASWKKVEIKPSRNDTYKTFAYIDRNIIHKCILISDDLYTEFEIEEIISEDEKYLLPKTSKGKPASLISGNLIKRKRYGMCLSYSKGFIDIYSCYNERSYYTNAYNDKAIKSMKEFSEWVKLWCKETKKEDIDEIFEFAKAERKNVRYCEGDVFRFKINRRLYGFGRIIADYDLMRKNKTEFWDILFGKTLVCSVYHIVSEDKNVPIEILKTLECLPSCFMADNRIFYGEYEIIGNIPVGVDEDYPIMYGESISLPERNMGRINFQRGTVFKSIYCSEVLNGCENFRNNGLSFNLNVRKDILIECIKKKSNQTYWKKYNNYIVNQDLRNPKFERERIAIYAQMDLLIN